MVCVYTVLYIFKVLYKEWLAAQTTDRMMPRNGVCYLLAEWVQNMQWETNVLEM